jgi:RNA recognition motif-containing protein
MAATVNVENISTKTSEDEIKSFFSFCGKIQSISVKPSGNDALSRRLLPRRRPCCSTTPS